MNIINRFFLFCLMLLSPLYRKLGVSVTQLRSILQAKLIMDDRRPNSIQQAQLRKGKKPIRFATIGTMLYAAFLGMVFLISFAVGKDADTKLMIYYSFFVVMLASVLISDFTSVLIDVRDTMIILPKPVNDATFLLSRLLHIVIHVTKIVLPMTFSGIITVWIMYGGLSVFPFFVELIAATLFTIFLINAVYILILKVTTPQKFKTVISYFQIFFGIVVYASYQLLPRMIDKVALGNYTVNEYSFINLVPTYWFARAWSYLHEGIFFSPGGIYFLLTLLLPVFSIWAVIKYFAPAFNRKLSMISGSDTEPISVKTDQKKIKKSTTSAYIRNAAKLLTQKGTERMGFLFTWKMMSRSRDFKMKVYPSIGYMVVYFVLILAGGSSSRHTSFKDMTDPSKPVAPVVVLTLIYMSCFIIIMAIMRIMYSDKYKASWIYYITPVAAPGRFISGALKSAILKFCAPALMVVNLFLLVFTGWRTLPNLLLGSANVIFTLAFIAYLLLNKLPFSVSDTNTSRSRSGFLRGLLAMFLPFLLSALHYLVYKNTIVVLIIAVLSFIAGWLMMDAIASKSWQKVQLAELSE